MSNEIILALIGTLLGGSGIITAIVTAVINRKKTRAEAEKNQADAAKIITDATKEILGEYRQRNDELEEELAGLKKDFRNLREKQAEAEAELTRRDKQYRTELDELDKKYRAEQALQDNAIENTNAKVLKLELLNVIYVSQIRSLGVKPLVDPSEIASISVDDLRNIARGLINIEERRNKDTQKLGGDDDR